jgi:hypothetical protein
VKIATARAAADPDVAAANAMSAEAKAKVAKGTGLRSPDSSSICPAIVIAAGVLASRPRIEKELNLDLTASERSLPG